MMLLISETDNISVLCSYHIDFERQFNVQDSRQPQMTTVGIYVRNGLLFIWMMLLTRATGRFESEGRPSA